MHVSHFSLLSLLLPYSVAFPPCDAPCLMMPEQESIILTLDTLTTRSVSQCIFVHFELSSLDYSLIKYHGRVGRNIIRAEGPGCLMHKAFTMPVIFTYVLLKIALIILRLKTEKPGKQKMWKSSCIQRFSENFRKLNSKSSDESHGTWTHSL